LSFLKRVCPKKKINYENFKLLNEKDVIETSMQLNPCLKGKHIGLLTDAGCPNIADPGSKLIMHAHENQIKVIPLVGPSSILLAMMASGLNGNNFSFNGYLPIEGKKRIKKIKEFEINSKKNNQTQIFIETPYRNQKLYNDLIKVLNDQTFLCIAINVGSKNQRIKTMSAGNWKTSKIKLSKDPSIFIFHSSFTIF
jgi:16S rRNA (cytidine1402-2'-O)-methyltransferase